MSVRQASKLQSGTTRQAADRDRDEGLLVEGQHDIHAQRESPVVVHIHVDVQTLETGAHSKQWDCLRTGKFKNRKSVHASECGEVNVYDDEVYVCVKKPKPSWLLDRIIIHSNFFNF